MEELLQRLMGVSICQKTNHRAPRLPTDQTELELEALQTTAAGRVPLTDPQEQVTQLLPKMTAHDDVETFLQMLETTATREGWEAEDQARLLAPLLCTYERGEKVVLGTTRK